MPRVGQQNYFEFYYYFSLLQVNVSKDLVMLEVFDEHRLVSALLPLPSLLRVTGERKRKIWREGEIKSIER